MINRLLERITALGGARSLNVQPRICRLLRPVRLVPRLKQSSIIA